MGPNREQQGHPGPGGRHRDGLHPLRRAVGQGRRRPLDRRHHRGRRLGSRPGAGRHRRLLAGHHDLGRLRHDAVAPPENRLQARHPCRELLRHGLGSLPQRLLRRGLGCLRHRHGHRRREAQGHRVLGPDRHPRRGRRHRPRPLVARRLLLPRPFLRPQVRRGQGPDEGGHEPDRLQEPSERGA